MNPTVNGLSYSVRLWVKRHDPVLHWCTIRGYPVNGVHHIIIGCSVEFSFSRYTDFRLTSERVRFSTMLPVPRRTRASSTGSNCSSLIESRGHMMAMKRQKRERKHFRQELLAMSP
uniref:Uncharacterized protein n=1 Tax=Amphimedon queenslandica TaxID=400682 RepID=A0A1X7UY87_AMPQE